MNESVYVRNKLLEGTPTGEGGSKKAQKGEDNERTDIQRNVHAKGGGKRGVAVR